MSRLAARGAETAVLHVISPADADPQIHGGILLESAETEVRTNIDINDSILEAYKSIWADFQRRCQSGCAAAGATYVAAATDIPPERLILQALHKAGLVGW